MKMNIKCNGKDFEIEEGLEIREALAEEIKNCGLKDVIAARYNNCLLYTSPSPRD